MTRALSVRAPRNATSWLDLSVVQFLAQLQPRHLLDGVFQRRGFAVVEIGPRDRDIAERRDLEHELVGVLLGHLEAAHVLLVGVGVGLAHLLVAVAAQQGAAGGSPRSRASRN